MKYELIEIFWGWLARPILLWNLNDICTVVLEIIVIKHFKPTGRNITVHIKQDDRQIWYCPENDIIDVKE